MDIENLQVVMHLTRDLRAQQERVKTLEAGPERYDALIRVDEGDYQGEPTGLSVTRAALIDKAVQMRAETAQALRNLGVTVSAEAEIALPALERSGMMKAERAYGGGAGGVGFGVSGGGGAACLPVPWALGAKRGG